MIKRKRKNKNDYWSQQMDDFITTYQTLPDEDKSDFYATHLFRPFSKLIECAINIWKSCDESYKDLATDLLTLCLSKIKYYDKEKAKSYSYFTIICRNELWQRGLKQKKRNEIILDLDGTIQGHKGEEIEDPIGNQLKDTKPNPYESLDTFDDFVKEMKEKWRKVTVEVTEGGTRLENSKKLIRVLINYYNNNLSMTNYRLLTKHLTEVSKMKHSMVLQCLRVISWNNYRLYTHWHRHGHLNNVEIVIPPTSELVSRVGYRNKKYVYEHVEKIYTDIPVGK